MLLRTLTLRTIIVYICLAILIGAAIFYVLFQARFLIAGPQITLTKEPNAVQSGEVVMIEGMAKNIVSITLNDRPIFVSEDGRFIEALILENGYSIMTLRAHDRYGRETELERSFVYSPAYQ